MNLLSSIECNLSPLERESFSSIIHLIDAIPKPILNVTESSFKRVVQFKAPFYEIVLVSNIPNICNLTFEIDLTPKNGSIFWACNGFNSIEESFFYDGIFDFMYLYNFISRILQSKISAQITLVKGKPKLGVYSFVFKDGTAETLKFRNGRIYPWNRVNKNEVIYKPWIV